MKHEGVEGFWALSESPETENGAQRPEVGRGGCGGGGGAGGGEGGGAGRGGGDGGSGGRGGLGGAGGGLVGGLIRHATVPDNKRAG